MTGSLPLHLRQRTLARGGKERGSSPPPPTLSTPPVQSYSTGRTRGCVVVSEAACMFECMPVCLHVWCTNHPSTSGSLWAAGWLCSLKRLCFCCHFNSPHLSLRAHIQVLFCMCLHHSLPPTPHLLPPSPPPPPFHYLCFIVIDFKGQGKTTEESLTHRLPHPAAYVVEEGRWRAPHNKAIYAATLAAHNHAAVCEASRGLRAPLPQRVCEKSERRQRGSGSAREARGGVSLT